MMEKRTYFNRIKCLVVLVLFLISIKAHSPQGICRVIENKILVVQHEESNSLRLLAPETPHAYKIRPDYYIDNNVALDIDNFKSIFTIASTYYERIIQVTDIPFQKTKYPQSNYGVTKCINLQVPETYLNTGFNQDEKDTVIFVKFFEDTSNIVGQSTSCVLYRWVLYGYMEYNNRFIPENFDNAEYHEYVLTIIHEITHVIGFAQHFWNQNLYYQNYLSWDHLSKTKIVKQLETGYQVIILPSVVQYVKNYFGCQNQLYNDVIGGLLQNQGGSGTANNHWQRAVFLDQLMTGSTFHSGKRISPITFYFLSDTGFFYSVDTGLSQTAYFGRGKGCQFALAGQATRSQRPQYCYPMRRQIANTFQCDYYGLYGGYCNFHPYSSKRPYIQFPANENAIHICPRQGKGLDRCLEKNSGGTGCYSAQCKQGIIEIKYNNQIGICTSLTQSIIVGGQSLKCPNIERFCWRKNCESWCQKNGICINKQCHSLSCDPSSISNCNSCQVNGMITTCLSCKMGFKPSINGLQCICDASTIPHCNSCKVTPENQVFCNSCDNSLIVSYDAKGCQCNPYNIEFCQACKFLSNEQEYCTSCIQNYIPTADGKKCMCDYRAIGRCQACQITGQIKKCTACAFDFQLNFDGSSCQLKKGNPYCKTLDENSFYICSSCYDGFYLIDGNCGACSPDCFTCTDSAQNCTS